MQLRKQTYKQTRIYLRIRLLDNSSFNKSSIGVLLVSDDVSILVCLLYVGHEGVVEASIGSDIVPHPVRHDEV